MTKMIRIENADNSDHKVTVQVMEEDQEGNVPDMMIEEVHLDNPTDMVEKTIWAGRYLVVK